MFGFTLLTKPNSAQICSILARFAQLITGFFTLTLVVEFSDLKTQGHFTTFNSLVSLQVFAELGLGMALQQFVAHEMSKMCWVGERIDGDNAAIQRLRSLVSIGIKWFSYGSLILMSTLIPFGVFFLERSSPSGVQTRSLQFSWILIVIFISFNLVIACLLSVIEATGKVVEVSVVRLVQYILGGVLAWIVILSTKGVWALVFQHGVVLFIGALYILVKRRAFVSQMLCGNRPLCTVNWMSEILPFQWRIAISWLCGYFVFQFAQPLVYIYSGPEEAGRVGLSMQIFSAISSVSIAFVTSRIPEFGQLVAKKKYSDMRRVFNRSAALSIVCMAMMVTAIVVADFVSEELKLNIVERILPFHQIVFLGSACIANHLVYVMSIYLRSHKVEPYVVLSIINAAFIAALNLVFVPRIGGQGAVNVFVLVSVFISLPLAAVIYYRFNPIKTLK